MVELVKRRKENGFSCKDMADKLHISKTFYWQIENCKRRLSYDMAVKIATILGTTPDILFLNEYKNKA